MSNRAQTVAITTYNREAELTACLACLGSANRLEDWSVVIRDDASTDYDIAGIVAGLSFPCAATRNPINLGIDANNVALLKACLAEGAERILLLDSDMIVSADALEFVEAVFDRTDGILSLYNSVLHHEAEAIDADLVRKETIGGAATVWDAGVLGRILERLDGSDLWDWQMSAIVRDLGIKLCVARQSRAQHIGINGINSLRFGELEFGSGFVVETADQAHALAAAYATLMGSQEVFRNGRSRYAPKPPRHKRWWRSISKRVRPRPSADLKNR
jgi:glycosyltransferase involved in cell wall biosynthesis